MTPLEQRTIEHLHEAAQDLGFRFVAPFTLDEAGQSLTYLGCFLSSVAEMVCLSSQPIHWTISSSLWMQQEHAISPTRVCQQATSHTTETLSSTCSTTGVGVHQSQRLRGFIRRPAATYEI